MLGVHRWGQRREAFVGRVAALGAVARGSKKIRRIAGIIRARKGLGRRGAGWI